MWLALLFYEYQCVGIESAVVVVFAADVNQDCAMLTL